MTIRILVDGKEVSTEPMEHEPVAVSMWWDRHQRHWVIYPVDAEGNQLGEEASYGMNKTEALEIKQEMEERLIGKMIYDVYGWWKKEH